MSENFSRRRASVILTEWNSLRSINSLSTYAREYNIDEVIQTKSPQFFETMTGISKDNFVELCDKGFMNRLALNRIVREFRAQETTSLNPEQYILENLLKIVS